MDDRRHRAAAGLTVGARLLRAGAVVAAAALALAACAAAGGDAQALRFKQPVVLLGEVHDNAAQHALRQRAFADWLAAGARPALALEQFDRDRQGAVDRVLAQQPPPDADAVIAAGGNLAPGGWTWAYYRPFVELALQYKLPIVAANVPRNEARAVMRQGLAATGFDPAVPPAVLDTLAQGIEASHCGMLDAETSRRMALAQVARDQYMARVVEQHAARGVLLLAGNGHVRTDLGVPLWLSPATRARSEAIGVLEEGDSSRAFDRSVYTPPQPRGDPCAGMRRPAAAPGAAASGPGVTAATAASAPR